ncbi:MAG TPA: hypothetical protein VKA84_29010, partial [Gemmatimonadaceae bacterium]|nr:hypothetical protein [Gemmatimonadaceae bacterium]
MKLAVLGESPADEAAVRILVEGILGTTAEEVQPRGIHGRGWPAVRDSLPAVLRYLHWKSDADALVVIVDSDDTTLHHPSHEANSAGARGCRLCELRAVIAGVQREFSSRLQGKPVKTAVGVAVPAIEAWYLCGIDPRASEASWAQVRQTSRFLHVKRQLKLRVTMTTASGRQVPPEAVSHPASRIPHPSSRLLHVRRVHRQPER